MVAVTKLFLSNRSQADGIKQMRGQQERTGLLFSYSSTKERIPKAHHLRQVQRLADQALDRLIPILCRL